MKISVVLLKSFLNKNSKKPSKNLKCNKCLPTIVTRTSHFLYRYFKLRDIIITLEPGETDEATVQCTKVIKKLSFIVPSLKYKHHQMLLMNTMIIKLQCKELLHA